MITILIAILVFGYALFVLRRKVQDVKKGKFCSCHCEGCNGSCKK